MGFFDSDSERGKKDGEEYKKKIERGEAGPMDLLDEIAGGVSPFTPPEYREAYDDAMSKSYGEKPSSRESESIEDSSPNSDYGSSSSDDDSDDSYYPDSSSSVDIDSGSSKKDGGGLVKRIIGAVSKEIMDLLEGKNQKDLGYIARCDSNPRVREAAENRLKEIS